MRIRYRTELLLVLLVIEITLTSRPASVYSQGCYFTSMNIFGPPNATEGQHIELHTVFSVTCSSGGYYLIRADLADGRTGQLLSTNRTQFAILGPFFAEVTNDVAVPKITGWWSLQMNLYLLENGVPAAPQSQQIFGLMINP